MLFNRSLMTANLLTLNCSKTEFLRIGLKKHLAKIHNSSLNTTHFACNLRIIFDEHFIFSDQISSLEILLLSQFQSLSPTHLFLYLSNLLIHHSHLPRLPHSFTLGSKFTRFTNISHRRLSSFRLPSSTSPGPYLLSYVSFCFYRQHCAQRKSAGI